MTTIPKGATVPEDHQKPAAQIEAEGVELVSVVCNGVAVAFPADPDEWPLESLMAFEDGKVGTALRAAMGAEQWAAVMKTKPVKRDLVVLYKSLAETLGFESSGE